MSVDNVTSLNSVPPLLGDGHGRYKVQIIGNSGSGKSTLGMQLGTILGVPHISLDSVFWQPNWVETPSLEMRKRVRAILDENSAGWVVDGNYSGRLGSLVQNEATDIIWLDPPLVLYFPRLCLRTLLRLFRLEQPCSPGCPETVQSAFFSRESIMWCNHWSVRKREQQHLREDGIHVGGRYRRIGGWGSELTVWKQNVQDMISSGVDD